MPGTYDTFMAMHVRFSFHDLGAVPRTIIFRAHLLPPKKKGGGERPFAIASFLHKGGYEVDGFCW